METTRKFSREGGGVRQYNIAPPAPQQKQIKLKAVQIYQYIVLLYTLQMQLI